MYDRRQSKQDIGTVILRQPGERNAHVYTTSFGDWAKGKCTDEDYGA
jgi:hypothetical protein